MVLLSFNSMPSTEYPLVHPVCFPTLPAPHRPMDRANERQAGETSLPCERDFGNRRGSGSGSGVREERGGGCRWRRRHRRGPGERLERDDDGCARPRLCYWCCRCCRGCRRGRRRSRGRRSSSSSSCPDCRRAHRSSFCLCYRGHSGGQRGGRRRGVSLTEPVVDDCATHQTISPIGLIFCVRLVMLFAFFSRVRRGGPGGRVKLPQCPPYRVAPRPARP